MIRVLHYPQLSLCGYAETLRRFNTRIIQLSPGRFTGTITVVLMQGCLLMRCHHNISTLVHGEVSDEVAFYFPLEAMPFYAINRTYRPAQQLVTAGKRKMAVLAPPDSGRLLVCLTHEAIHNVLGQTGYDRFLVQVKKMEDEGLVCHGKARLTAELWELMQRCVDCSKGQGPLLTPADVTTAIVQRIFTYLKDEHYRADIAPSGHDRIMQYALNLLTEGTAHQLDIEMLSKRVFASRRNLTYAFNDVFNISPKRFLKAVQFNEIRERLLDGAVPDSLTDLFAEYGSTNPARSMREYQELFAEHPRETLQSMAVSK